MTTELKKRISQRLRTGRREYSTPDCFRPMATRMVNTGMKLQQGQIWVKGDEFIRIVRRERLWVVYKIMTAPDAAEGTIHQVSKKDFCRLIKGAVLMDSHQSPDSTGL